MNVMSTDSTSEDLRSSMVAALKQSGAITTDRVADAFLSVPRERFVGEIAAREGIVAVYRPETALVTSTDFRGQAISSSSATNIMAPMLEALDLSPGLRVLEIGAGTGYNAALLAVLVSPGGRVTTVDIDPAFAQGAREALRDGGWDVRVMVGDGREGWPDDAPFDRIIVTASAAEVPPAWHDQLVDGGLVVVPMRFTPTFHAVAAFRREGPRLTSTRLIPGGFMPLREAGVSPPPPRSDARMMVAAGPGADGVILSGPWLGKLSQARRQGLMMSMISSGQRSPKRLSVEEGNALNLFLNLSPRRRIVMVQAHGRHGAGVLDPRGPGVAAVRVGQGRPARIEAWGDPHALEELMELVAEWERLGKPGFAQLRVESIAGHPRLRRPHWRTIHTANSTLVFNWDT